MNTPSGAGIRAPVTNAATDPTSTPTPVDDRTADEAVDPDPTTTTDAFAARPVLAVAAVTTAVLLLGSTRYGYHRDEFYYLWGGENPAWGYVDHPPLVPFVAHAVDVLGGHTLIALRLVPALIAGWLVVAGALITRDLGGSRRAQVIAAFAVACAPATRAPEVLFGTTAFDAAVWAGLLVVTTRLLRTRNPKLWIVFGVIAGVGLETKWSVGVLIGGLVLGILLSDQRRLLWSPYLLLGGIIALALWAPNLWWNAAHDWPTLEFQRSVAEENGALDQRLLFFPMVLLLSGVATVVVWGPGLVGLLRRSVLGDRFRALGLATVIVVAVVFVAGGKPYYMVPMYLVLFAAGAIVVDRADLAGRRPVRTSVITLAVAGACTIPLTLPVLPPAALNAIHPINPEFGEMVGWPELAATAKQTFDALPAGEQPHTIILTTNYGSAGAIRRDEPALPVYTAQNSHWYEGPPPATATTVITIGYSQRTLERWCASIEQIGLVTNAFGVENYEHNRPIYACRDLKRPWSELWNDLKHFE